MRLTQKTDYALRALMYLANAESATVAEIANAHSVSRAHMAKVMSALAEAGFVITRRGRGGAARLAKPAHRLRVGAVVRALEPLEYADCFRASGACALQGGCALTAALEEAGEAFLRKLDKVRLSQLAGERSMELVALQGPRR